jgi:hypothetical protein
LREPDLEQEIVDGSIGGSSKREETDGGIVRLHSLAAQRRRRGSSLRGLQKGNLSPRQLSPREVVAHHVQSITPRSYSVAVSPRHEGYGHGFGMDGITQSLEHSLGSVPGVSLDTRNKHYRVAAGVELDAGGSSLRDEGGGESTPHIHTFRNRPTSALSPRRSSSRDISPRSSIKNQFEQSGEASVDGSGSRPHSASPYNGRSMRAHSPISRVPSQSAVDAPPAMKRKLSKSSAPPPTACDLANKQLLATRMLKSIAAAGAAIRTSIRASFSNDKTKVYAEAAAAAAAAAAASNADEQTADFRVAHKKPPTPHSHSADSSSTASSKGASVLNSSSTSITAEAAAINSAAAVTSAGAGPRPGPGSSTAEARQAGGFASGGFLSVDVIRSMVRKVTFQ